MTAENSAEINDILNYFQIENSFFNCNNISEYYCFTVFLIK